MLKSDSETRTVFSLHRDVLGNLSKDEIQTIANIKRLIERLYGDPDFLSELRANPSSGRKLANKCGANIDPDDLSSVWDRPGELPIQTDELGDSPLAKLWCEWAAEIADANKLMRIHGETSKKNPQFHAWRLRQINRIVSQLGNHGKNFSHPVFAFELSLGCKVQCPFCAFNAEKFKESFKRNDKNKRLWRDILRASFDIFGRAAQTSVCYWATEPFDNPDYIRFIRDFEEIIGELPQTTTAVPLRDVKVTRELLKLQNGFQSIQNRFSVLTTKVLRQIHDMFTPMELVNVKLLLFNRPNILKMARSGRILDSRNESLQDDTTIACTAGFIVNMVKRSVELISPCPASGKFPLGYRLHYRGTFRDTDEFQSCIKNAISDCMPEYIENESIAALRDDVKYEKSSKGICFISKFNKTNLGGKDFLGKMGDMISTGKYSAGRIIGSLVGNGADYFEVAGTLQAIFNKGLLDNSSTVLEYEKEK